MPGRQMDRALSVLTVESQIISIFCYNVVYFDVLSFST